MRRVTVTIPDDLAEAVDRLVRTQKARPPLTAVIQAALRQFLTNRGYLRAPEPLRIKASRRGSGRRDVSSGHDRHLAAR